MTAPAMTEAVAVWPSGRTQPGRAKAGKVQTAADAIISLQRGAVCVFVARGDADAVCAAVRGEGVGRGETL